MPVPHESQKDMQLWSFFSQLEHFAVQQESQKDM
jgi:hypothetical protein